MVSMTQPSIVRDGDGSTWHRQSDGTYKIRTGNTYLDGVYHSYELAQIEDEFGIISKTYDTPDGSQSYAFLRRR